MSPLRYPRHTMVSEVNLCEVSELPPELPVAQLQAIDPQRLVEGDKAESAKLFEAARKDGLFYLNVRQFGELGTPQLIEDTFCLARELFDLPEAEKLTCDVDKLGKMKLNGYDVYASPLYRTYILTNTSFKPMGRNYGGLAGNRDGFESYVAGDLSVVVLPYYTNPASCPRTES
jgi:hypothetical protein